MNRHAASPFHRRDRRGPRRGLQRFSRQLGLSLRPTGERPDSNHFFRDESGRKRKESYETALHPPYHE